MHPIEEKTLQRRRSIGVQLLDHRFSSSEGVQPIGGSSRRVNLLRTRKIKPQARLLPAQSADPFRFSNALETNGSLVQINPASGLDGSAYMRLPIRPAR
jgi:hypothetical protein